MPEFPPRQGKFKVPGRVEVRGQGHEAVYDLYGNGHDINRTCDEAFFVYTERSGSWSLSGKFEWIDPGTPMIRSRKPNLGVMIRDRAASPESRHYCCNMMPRVSGVPGERLTEAKWRSFTRGGTAHRYLSRQDGEDIMRPGETIYLRVSRLAPMNHLFSEWSKDGKQWNFAHSMVMGLQETVAYGFFIHNCEDNEELAHARVSNVSLERLQQPVAIRFISAEHLWKATPGTFVGPDVYRDQITVFLEVANPRRTPAEATIQEILPPGWTASCISHGGIEKNGVIRWSLRLEPGPTVLKYIVRPSPDAEDVAVFSGKVDSLQTGGTNILTKKGLDKVTFYFALYLGVLLVLLIIHLLLFFFYPKSKQNLYLAALLGCSGGIIYLSVQLTFLPEFTGPSQLFVNLLNTLLSLGMAVILLFVYSIVYPRVPRKYWIFFGLCVFCGIAAWFMYNYSLLLICVLVVFVIVCLESLRAVVSALIRGSEGIKIIAFGAVILMADIPGRRQGHPPRTLVQSLRSVLHDKAGRQRDGARPLHRLWDHRTAWGDDHGRQ